MPFYYSLNLKKYVKLHELGVSTPIGLTFISRLDISESFSIAILWYSSASRLASVNCKSNSVHFCFKLFISVVKRLVWLFNSYCSVSIWVCLSLNCSFESFKPFSINIKRVCCFFDNDVSSTLSFLSDAWRENKLFFLFSFNKSGCRSFNHATNLLSDSMIAYDCWVSHCRLYYQAISVWQQTRRFEPVIRDFFPLVLLLDPANRQ